MINPLTKIRCLKMDLKTQLHEAIGQTEHIKETSVLIRNQVKEKTDRYILTEAEKKR